MKRILCIIFSVLMMLTLCACGTSNKNKVSEVTLVFNANGENVSETLTDEEAAKLIEIFDGNSLQNLYRGTPSCSFDENVAIKIADRTYAIALDTCGIVKELSSNKHFSITDEDIAYIHSVFVKYGGYFPCV